LNNFEYVLIILFGILGILLLCSSNDLITSYLAIELQGLAFYVLASFKKSSSFSIEAGLKYFIVGAFSSSLFLLGSSFLYGVSGTVNLEEFKTLFMFVNQPYNDVVINMELVYLGLALILSSLFFKLVVAPFHVWAPSVYEGSPTSSTLFFSVVPKIALFVFLVRLFYSSFEFVLNSWRYFLIVIILFSLVVGSFGGLEQRKLKSLLVYSSISHMGYTLLAFSTGMKEGLQFLFGYLLIYSFSGLCVWSIFIILRLKNKNYLKSNRDLGDFVLLCKSNPMVSILFSIVLFSLAGFPPMIGFLLKLGVFLTVIDTSMYFVAVVSVLCSVVATFYYIRVIKVLFFEKSLVGRLYHPINTQKALLIVVLVYLIVFLFCNPTLLFLFIYKLSLLF
jgi:NADH-quinone oxidoreductase subunit N